MTVFFHADQEVFYNSKFPVFSTTGESLITEATTDAQGFICTRFLESDLKIYSENDIEVFMFDDAEEAEEGFKKVKAIKILEESEDDKYIYRRHHEGFLIESKKTGDTGFYQRKKDADFI